MAASLKVADPALRKYIQVNRLPDIYEALLTGLAVMCPDDPYDFIMRSLRYVHAHGYKVLQWDMFVDIDMRPSSRIITETQLDWLFDMENSMPTREMYMKAYSFYNHGLKSMCFNAWMQYHLRKKEKKEMMRQQMKKAIIHFNHRLMRLRIRHWLVWTQFRKGRQAMAFHKIQHVYYVSVCRVIFDAWHDVAMDAKRTREYFERLERGEHMDEEEEFHRGTGEARDDISMMPRKVAIKIFSYVDISDLARCACVCRSWKVLTTTPSLWTQLDFAKIKNRLIDGVTDRIATRLLQKCRPYLVHLNLRGCNYITRKTFQSISECRNIQDLNLSECAEINDETLKHVVEGCTILLYLNISHNHITDGGLRIIGKYCCNLQYLSLAYCKKFTNKGILYLAHGKGAKKLIYLDLSGCTQLTGEGFKSLCSQDGCTSLTSVVLNEFPALDDTCTTYVIERCKQLAHISFLGSPLLSDEAFKLLGASRKLRTLKIEANQKVTDASLKVIGKHCSDLRHLHLTDCMKITDHSLKALSACKHLTVLNLADCVRISDTGVRYIVESPCGPRLRELNLTNCIRVGDIAVVNIHKRCHSLAYLTVNFCEHISEAGIELLGQAHSLAYLDICGCNCGDAGLSALGNNSNLRSVTLSECSSITDLGLQKFAQQSREIEALDLSHCHMLTDAAIKNLAFCCRLLNVLNLAGCRLLTDLSVQYLSGVCHYLRCLDISGCILVTDKSLKYLKKGCKKLKKLSLLYCKGVTKHAAQKLMRAIEVVEYNDDDIPPWFGYS